MDDIRPPKLEISLDEIVARNCDHLWNGTLGEKQDVGRLLKEICSLQLSLVIN